MGCGRSDQGRRRILRRLPDVREHLLVDRIKAGAITEDALSETATRLRMLSGNYNQAARSPATLDPPDRRTAR